MVGSKDFGQNLIFPHCERIDKRMLDHDHFLICDHSTRRKDDRLNKLREVLNNLHTVINLTEDIIEGIKNYYNQTVFIRKDNPTAIENQNRIGWGYFCLVCLRKNIGLTMTDKYKESNKTTTFTGNGWMKLIVFNLATNVEEWYVRYQLITKTKKYHSQQ